MKKYIVKTKYILPIYCIIVALAKIVRFTILKGSLVDYTKGWGWVDDLNNGIGNFIISSSGESVATQNSIALFKYLRFFGASTFYEYEALITIIFNILLIACIFKCKKKNTTMEFIFLCMSIAVLNIWNFTLAKEPMQMLFFVAIFIILNTNLNNVCKFIFSLLVILLSVYIYRNYYILVVLYSIFCFLLAEMYISKQKKVTKKVFIVSILAIFVSHIIFFTATKNLAKDVYEQLIYLSNNVTTANTDITPIFNSDNIFLTSVEYIITILRMLVPVELVVKGPKYILYFAYQVLISIFLVRGIMNLKTNSKRVNYAIYIYLGFLLASAYFEPDFGSWVRHESTTFPILLMAFGFIKEENQNENINN